MKVDWDKMHNSNRQYEGHFTTAAHILSSLMNRWALPPRIVYPVVPHWIYFFSRHTNSAVVFDCFNFTMHFVKSFSHILISLGVLALLCVLTTSRRNSSLSFFKSSCTRGLLRISKNPTSNSTTWSLCKICQIMTHVLLLLFHRARSGSTVCQTTSPYPDHNATDRLFFNERSSEVHFLSPIRPRISELLFSSFFCEFSFS